MTAIVSNAMTVSWKSKYEDQLDFLKCDISE